MRTTALTRAQTPFLYLSLLAPLLPVVAQAVQRSSQTPSPARTAPSELIDINHCSSDQLLSIPGMTRVWAERIVCFRPYRTKADLEDQGVIPAALYDRIKDSIIAHRLKQ